MASPTPFPVVVRDTVDPLVPPCALLDMSLGQAADFPFGAAAASFVDVLHQNGLLLDKFARIDVVGQLLVGVH